MNANADDFNVHDLSDDQREITAYFASDRYQRLRQGIDEYSDGTIVRPLFLDDGMPAVEPISWLAGLVGLAMLTAVTSGIVPAVMKLLEYIFDATTPPFLWILVLMQTMVLPPLACLSVAVVITMFWHGSILVRFLMTLAVSIPAYLGFAGTYMLFNNSDDDTLPILRAGMFALAVVAGSISLTVQLWSPWTLLHGRDQPIMLKATGLRSMIELMVVAAIVFAAIFTVPRDDAVEGIMLAVIMPVAVASTVISVAGILALIGILRDTRWSRPCVMIGSGLVLLGVGALNGLIATLEFGSSALIVEFVPLTATSLWGTVVTMAMIAIPIAWLRCCGWQCVHRRRQRQQGRCPS